MERNNLDFSRSVQILQNGLDAGAYPGIAFAIGCGDELLDSGFMGHRQVNPTPLPLEQGTLFDLASLSKLVSTTMVALRMLERGEIELTDPLSRYFEIPAEEMYGERFDIPTPDELIFLGWFAGGEVFRSGCCWTRGLGKIFYFQPGHESNPTFHNEYVQRIIINAVRWAKPEVAVIEPVPCPHKKISPEERYKERKTN